MGTFDITFQILLALRFLLGCLALGGIRRFARGLDDEDCDVSMPLDSLMESSMALLAADCMASVITMANTDSTAATWTAPCRVLAPEGAHYGDNRQYDADEAKDCGDIVDDGNKTQYQTQRAKHHGRDAADGGMQMLRLRRLRLRLLWLVLLWG